MAKKRTVIYKLERHKWPDEIAAEKGNGVKSWLSSAAVCCFLPPVFLFPVRWEKVPREQRTPWRWKNWRQCIPC